MICPGYCVLLSERKRKQGCSRYASFFTAPRVPPAHLPAQAWEQGAENKEQRTDGSQPPDTNRCPIPDSGSRWRELRGFCSSFVRGWTSARWEGWQSEIPISRWRQLDECALGGMAPHVAGRDGSAGTRCRPCPRHPYGVTATPLICSVRPVASFLTGKWCQRCRLTLRSRPARRSGLRRLWSDATVDEKSPSPRGDGDVMWSIGGSNP